MVASEYESRDRPSMLVLAAWNRASEATIATIQRNRFSTHCGSNWSTIPSTGASTYCVPSAVVVPLTGTAITATAEMPTKTTSTTSVPTITSRRSSAVAACTSPANPEAASMPVSATVATTRPKIRSSHCGAVPRWIESVTTLGSENSDSPTASTAKSATRLTSPTVSTSRRRSIGRPRMLRPAIDAIASAATTKVGPRASASGHRTVR